MQFVFKHFFVNFLIEQEMKVIQCISVVCGKPFQVNQFNTALATPYSMGVIKCPHCGAVIESSAKSLFLTHALSPQQEAQFFDALAVA